jgi:hypothetical protein
MNIIEKLELEWQKSPVKPDQFLLSQDDYEEYAKTVYQLRQIEELNGKVRFRFVDPPDLEFDELEFRSIKVRWDGRRKK